eukprot:9429491-Pyramimonas_sp.AAC.1
MSPAALGTWNAFERIYVPECISRRMDAASTFFSDLFESAGSYWFVCAENLRTRGKTCSTRKAKTKFAGNL